MDITHKASWEELDMLTTCREVIVYIKQCDIKGERCSFLNNPLSLIDPNWAVPTVYGTIRYGYRVNPNNFMIVKALTIAEHEFLFYFNLGFIPSLILDDDKIKKPIGQLLSIPPLETGSDSTKENNRTTYKKFFHKLLKSIFKH